MQARIPLMLGNIELVAVVDFRVTDKGGAPSGPTYACGGEPGWGPEFEIESVELTPTHDGPAERVVLPKWLAEMIETDIRETCHDDLEAAARVAGAL